MTKPLFCKTCPHSRGYHENCQSWTGLRVGSCSQCTCVKYRSSGSVMLKQDYIAVIISTFFVASLLVFVLIPFVDSLNIGSSISIAILTASIFLLVICTSILGVYFTKNCGDLPNMKSIQATK